MKRKSPRWTPEPWRSETINDHLDIGYNASRAILKELPEGKLRVVAEVWKTNDSLASMDDDKEGLGNLDRIVDCINGCVGINPRAVGDMLSALRIARTTLQHFELGNYDSTVLKVVAKAIIDAEKPLDPATGL